jgi:hypothetical protein
MAEPTTRAELIGTCKRRLGDPIAKINITEEQADDRVDQALKYYYDYHFNGAEHMYYKHVITANNFADAVYDCTVVAGGTGYANADVVVFTTAGGIGGSGATATIVTDGSGVIQTCTLDTNGSEYGIAPTVSLTTGGGTGASITCELGGFIPMPENIIGAIKIFPIGDSNNSTNNIFSIKYQIALNDLYTLTSNSIVPYFSAFQHIRLLEEILVGQAPIRYNRHKNRLYVDMDWNSAVTGNFMIVEAYQIVDPETWADVYKDHWLIKYTTALFKLQWGNNMKKFTGTMLPGNVQLNGQTIYDEALMEIAQLEQEMITSYSIPATWFIG